MKEYIITVRNGAYPLKYRCKTAHEAYGCIATLAQGLLQDNVIDLDKALCDIARMADGNMRSAVRHGYGIESLEVKE